MAPFGPPPFCRACRAASVFARTEIRWVSPWPQGNLARCDRKPVRDSGDKADMKNRMVGVAYLKGQDMDTTLCPIRGRKS